MANTPQHDQSSADPALRSILPLRTSDAVFVCTVKRRLVVRFHIRLVFSTNATSRLMLTKTHITRAIIYQSVSSMA